ncbi:MAG: LamG domain-containing protein [archaeon]
MNKSNCVELFKSYDAESISSMEKQQLDGYTLLNVKEAESMLQKGQQVFFLDENGHEIAVNSITKESYNDRIYDVTVPNHIILVRRGNLTAWSGNSLQTNFTNLSGTYTYKAYAVDMAGNVNETEERTLVVNNAPTQTVPTITPTTAYTNDTITCNYNNTQDLDGDSVVNITNWYRNNQSTMLLYLPFEGGSNSTHIKDYSGYNFKTEVTTGYGYNAGVYNATWNRTGGRIGGAYYFNNTESVPPRDLISYGDLNEFDFQGSFTLEAWTNRILDRSDHVDSIISKYDCCGENGYSLEINSDNFGNLIYMYISDGTHSYRVDSSIGIAGDSGWHHVVAVVDRFSEQNTTIYIDGIERKGTTTGTLASVYDISSTNSLQIGTRGFYNGFSGYIDDVRIYNYSLSSDQIYQNYIDGLSNHNPNKISYNDTNINETWHCEVTPNDGYTDGSTFNSSERLISNWAPSITNISFSPLEPTLNDNINCNATAIDLENTTLTIEYWWYNNSILFLNGNTTGVSANINTIISTINAANTSSYQNWNCTIRAYDGSDYSEYASVNYTFTNSFPSKVNLSYPTNGDIFFTNRSPEFRWQNATDLDNDLLSYHIELSLNSDISSPLLNISAIGENSTVYSGVLDFATYYWRVRANDSEGYGEWSDIWNFTLEPELNLILTTSTVEFGLVEVSHTYDTDTVPYSPLIVENNGNILANITRISVNESLWTTVNASTSYFQFKADNESTEANSFNWTASQTTWENMTLYNESNSTLIAELDWLDDKDNAEIDIRITVPAFEPPQERHVTVYVIGENS